MQSRLTKEVMTCPNIHKEIKHHLSIVAIVTNKPKLANAP